jgi:predicted transposase YbfD/YdcC
VAKRTCSPRPTSGPATIAWAAIDTKSDEITIAAPVFEALDFAGHIVTTDVMHAQRQLALVSGGEPGALHLSSRPGAPACRSAICRAIRP